MRRSIHVDIDRIVLDRPYSAAERARLVEAVERRLAHDLSTGGDDPTAPRPHPPRGSTPALETVAADIARAVHRSIGGRLPTPAPRKSGTR